MAEKEEAIVVETPEVKPEDAQGKSEDTDFSSVPKEYMPAIEKARSQEKAKLYKERAEMKEEIRTLRDKLKEVETQIAATREPAKKEKKEDAADDLRDMIKQLQQQMVESERRAQEVIRQAEINRYKQQAIATAKTEGGLVESLVAGNSPEEIDAAIAVAQAEYKLLEEDFKKRYATVPRQVTVQTPTGKPAGVAQTIAAGTPGDRTSTLRLADIKEMASIDNLRNGKYAKNRDEILAALRAGRIVAE